MKAQRKEIIFSAVLAVCAAVLELSACTSLESVSQKELAGIAGHMSAIVDVNLITLATGGVARHHTVIIENQRIRAIGPSDDVTIPADARVISGKGKYLLPGFIDMHVHICADADLLKFLKYGVTTVRNMSDVPWWTKAMGFSDVLSLRNEQRSGKVIGPDIYTCGYVLDGDPLVSPMNKRLASSTQAVNEIRKEHGAGYDFIKIYDNLSPEVFSAIAAEAGKHGLAVVGHVPYRVGIDNVLRSNVLSIEHMTGYIDNNTGSFLIPEEEISAYAERTRESEIYNCPTLVVWDNIPPRNHVEKLKADPDYRYVPGYLKWLWKRSLSSVYTTTYADKAGYAGHMMEISRKMLAALYTAGCPLMVGTDANFIGVYPGSSALREMELFALAGVSNLDILKSASLVPSRALHRENEIGTIAVGKVANMVLLEADPLADISNIRRTTGVFIRGVWISRDNIEKMLASVM